VSSQPHITNTTNIVLATELDSDSSDAEGDSDDDSEDDGGDRVPPYDPNEQDRPKLPIYHPGFALTEDLAQNILRTFIDYITRSMNEGYKDEEAKHLRSEVLSYKTVSYQETVQLAVAGDTGAGKSALLNAILGVVNLNIEVRPKLPIQGSS
jgi:hypothetical protein